MNKGPSFQESGPTYEMDVYCDETTSQEYLFTTSKDQPVHMRQASENYAIKTSFLCKNQVEEVISPISLRANQLNKMLVTGHNRGLVKVFDINRPDEQAVSLELKIGK